MKTEQDKIRYALRNQMENIIKLQNIDRNTFHEASKFNWQNIIRRLYYTFCDYQRGSVSYLWKDSPQENWHCQADQSNFYGWYPYMWLNIRKDLPVSDMIYESEWEEYIRHIFDFAPLLNDRMFYYLLTDGGWLYEGTLPAIIHVLSDYPVNMEEFYLFPKDYSWLITHSDDAGCMRKTVYSH